MQYKLQKQKPMSSGTTDPSGKFWEVAMSVDEAACLESYLTSDVDMLEWGCGGSTLKFAPMVNHMDSIEHQLEWYNGIKDVAPPNVNLHYVPPNSPEQRDPSLESSSWNVWKPILNHPTCRTENDTIFIELRDQRDWHEYINYINYPTSLKKKYDVILVDGRARPNCAFKALSLLKEDGIIMVHDFTPNRYDKGRWYYYGILHYYDLIDHGGSLGIFKPKKEFIQ